VTHWRTGLGVIGVSLAPAALAGVWLFEPKIALSGEYDTNGDFTTLTRSPSSVGAAAFDLPLRFYTDGGSFSVVPRIRVGDAHTYASFGSDYAYLDAIASVERERFKGSLDAGWSSDSTVHSGLDSALAGQPNVRRTADNGYGTAQYDLTERATIDFELQWSRVRYASNATLAGYDYDTALLDYAYALTPRLRLTAEIDVSHQVAQSDVESSKSGAALLGVKSQLTETWTFNASAGRSKLVTQYFFLPIAQFEFDSRANNYAAGLEHQGERTVANFSATRSLAPSGIGSLVDRTDYSLSVNRNLTERMACGAEAHRDRSNDALGFNDNGHRDWTTIVASVQWHLTPLWDVAARASWTNLLYRYPSLDASAANTGVYVIFTRNFGPRRLSAPWLR
jgi:hypothetical protein